MDEYPWGVEEERKGRAAVLVADAEALIAEEPPQVGNFHARRLTRDWLILRAKNLGFSPNEISAAVDEAITAAGGVP